jgi:hypothetical protein
VRYRLDQMETPVTIPTCTPRTLEGEPVDVTLAHLARFVGTEVVDRPLAYAVPATVAAHLRGHGLAVQSASGEVECEIARVESVSAEAGRAILEAAEFGDVSVSWQRQARALPEGYEIVRTDQPLGAVAVYLCEPRSDDGLAENGVIGAPRMGVEHPVWRIVDGLG